MCGCDCDGAIVVRWCAGCRAIRGENGRTPEARFRPAILHATPNTVVIQNKISAQAKLGRGTLVFCLILHGFVSDFETFVDDGEGFAELLFVDAERWVGEKGVPTHQCIKALFTEEAA